MKKELIKLGQKLYWDGRKDNVAVIVVDVDLNGEYVGIMDGGITHIVEAKHLAETPSNQETVEYAHYGTQNVVDKVVCTKPKIEISYDDGTHSLFLVINNKTTVCIPHVSKDVMDAIGMSYRHDDDDYNQKIGHSLAFFRAISNEIQADEKRMKLPDGFPFRIF